MNTNRDSWLSRNRWILIVTGVPVLAGAWWAFRPEKLFINQKVNEAAPAALSSEPEALYTGRLEGNPDERASDDLQVLRWQAIFAAFGFRDFEWAGRARAAGAWGGQGTWAGNRERRPRWRGAWFTEGEPGRSEL